MERGFLLTGSNLGNRLENLRVARKFISDFSEIRQVSGIYQTQAWGIEDQPEFLNQVIEIQTGLGPDSLLREILEVEEKMGRDRKEKWGSRLIDIDILFYGDSILDETNLTIPHPEIQNRRFTLAPLSEIAQDLVHPKLGKTILELMETCKDPLEARLVYPSTEATSASR